MKSDPRMTRWHSAVVARDGGCIFGHGTYGAVGHHLIRRRFRSKHDPRIGITLCPICHSKAHMISESKTREMGVKHLIEIGVWPNVETWEAYRRFVENHCHLCRGDAKAILGDGWCDCFQPVIDAAKGFEVIPNYAVE